MRERENKRSSRKVVHLFQKRWVFPTLYIVCAAVILTVALWYQAANTKKTPEKNEATPQSVSEIPTMPVTKSSEVVKMPTANAAEVVVKKKFYEDKAAAEEQEQALVFYNNTYSANTGIDITAKNGKEFDVTAALSGTVTKAEKDPLLGYVVTVDNGNGVTTFYQSLGSAKVEKGAKINQGEMLGKAGLSEMNKEAGYHVHFEVRKDNVAVNPELYFDKSVADIKVEKQEKQKEEKSTNGATDEKQKEEKSTNSPADDKKKEEKSTSGTNDEKQKEEKSTSGTNDEKQKEEKSTNSSTDDKKKEEKSTNSSAGQDDSSSAEQTE
ncbi:peptidase M23 [Bacillus sp. AFS018417]|uniref:M23 family metallopeptidase n=1 Tax=Bacillus sp. AFS018417 TaxID=2033491 RepID=UPI000BF89D38|nr:M23 family metallopeptidase [Bacillus sp. AFS018417]PEZ03483.1 peptidase M23 [Bacillus sp. AFS018417]